MSGERARAAGRPRTRQREAPRETPPETLEDRWLLEAQTARLREVEAQLETLRVAHYAASDAMQGAQGALYEANAEVSRLFTLIGIEVPVTRGETPRLLVRIGGPGGRMMALAS